MRALQWCGPLPLLFLVACGPGAQNLQDRSAEVRSIIEASNASLARYYTAGQMDSVAAIFAPDARQMGPNMEPLVGREAIREFWEQAAGLGTWTFTLNTQDVVAYGPLAVERGWYTLDFLPGPDALPGMVASADTGNYLVRWRLEGDRWLIADDLATSQKSLEVVCADYP